jgi:outer membrane immunogenic protein
MKQVLGAVLGLGLLTGAAQAQNVNHSFGGWQGGLVGGGNLEGAGVFGAFIGYNQQTRNGLVFGLEADVMKLFNFDQQSVEETNNSKTTQGFDVDFYASIRGRLGFVAHPAFMPYLTAGYAWTGGNAFQFCNSSGECEACYNGEQIVKSFEHSTNFTAGGIVWGGGVEARFFENVNVRVEVLRYEFGDVVVSHGSGEQTINLTDNVVRIGIGLRY